MMDLPFVRFRGRGIRLCTHKLAAWRGEELTVARFATGDPITVQGAYTTSCTTSAPAMPIPNRWGSPR
ncbi:MAG: hypothetical protein QOK44_3575 [Betaproteobacteria bacterium]|nr:hypothetical protein [Betaproteobacteria bacterium]